MPGVFVMNAPSRRWEQAGEETGVTKPGARSDGPSAEQTKAAHSSSILRSPRFEHFKSLRLRKSLEIGAWLTAATLVVLLGAGLDVWLALGDSVRVDVWILLTVSLALVAGARQLRPTRRRKDRALPPSRFERATAFELWSVLGAAARVDLGDDGLGIVSPLSQRFIRYASIRRCDWAVDGIELELDGEPLVFLRTCKLPRRSRLVNHFRELRHALRAATASAMSHNQRIAERIDAECRRCQPSGYRVRARSAA